METLKKKTGPGIVREIADWFDAIGKLGVSVKMLITGILACIGAFLAVLVFDTGDISEKEEFNRKSTTLPERNSARIYDGLNVSGVWYDESGTNFHITQFDNTLHIKATVNTEYNIPVTFEGNGALRGSTANVIANCTSLGNEVMKLPLHLSFSSDNLATLTMTLNGAEVVGPLYKSAR